ncbi:MAG: apolipoprotein N-acyltransferase [Pseudooceanicola sp.]
MATTWRGLAVAAAGGGLAALGQAPFDLWLPSLIAFAVILRLLDRAPTARAAAWTGWAAGTGYFLVALHWIVEPFLVDIARHGWMAPFALVFMAGGLALFWGVAAGLARWLIPPGRVPAFPAFVVFLTLAEMARSVIFTGFPWASIGHVLIASPMIHLAAWFGPHALTLVVLAVAAGLVRVPERPLRAGLPMVLAVTGIWLAAPRFASDVPITPTDAPVLRLMQPNAPQHQKWHPVMMPVFFERLLDYSGATPIPDVTIWPETSVPAFLEGAGNLLNVIADRAGGATSVIGIERREDGRYYNSLAVIGPDGTLGDVYDKHHLVPFGEYLPLAGPLSRLGLAPMVDRYGGFSPGPGPQLVDLGLAGTALPLICYEAVFPRDVRGTSIRPDFLLQITNDAWFGTFSGPYQHLAQARLRAVERGLPMIRVANTGVTAVIAADGRVLQAIPLGEAGYIDTLRPEPAAPTYYALFGDIPVTMVLLLSLGLLFLARRVDLRTRSH